MSNKPCRWGRTITGVSLKESSEYIQAKFLESTDMENLPDICGDPRSGQSVYCERHKEIMNNIRKARPRPSYQGRYRGSEMRENRRETKYGRD